MEWVDKYIGIPFSNHGRDFSGCDCWGLAKLILSEEFGKYVPNYSYEYHDSMDKKNVGDLIAHESKTLGVIEEVEKPDVGDIIVFNIQGNPCHIGLYIGKNKVIHINKGQDSIIESIFSPRLKNRIEGFYHVTD